MTKTAHGWTTYGSIDATKTPVTEDLPATGDTPYSLDLTTDVTTKALNLVLTGDAYIAWGATAADAVTNIGADETRLKVPAGAYTIPVEAFAGGLAFKAQAAAVTDGLSYFKVVG